MNSLIHEIIDASYWKDKNKSKMENSCLSCICIQRRNRCGCLINFVSRWTFYVWWCLSFHFLFLLLFPMMIQLILYDSVIICWIEGPVLQKYIFIFFHFSKKSRTLSSHYQTISLFSHKKLETPFTFISHQSILFTIPKHSLTVYDMINWTVWHLIMFQFNSLSTCASSHAGLGLGVQAPGLNNVTSATLQQQNNFIHQQALMSSGPKDASNRHVVNF